MMINATGGRLSGEISRMSRLGREIARTQVEVSTSKRIQTASDDPVAAARVATIRRAQTDAATFAANRTAGTAAAAQADSVLASLADRMTHARELVVAGASDTISATDRATLASELRSIAAEIEDFGATTTARGDPLFAARALEIRFAADARFAPVAAYSDIFERGGIALVTMVRDAADTLAANDAPAARAALTTLEDGIAHVATVSADQGLRAARLERLDDVGAARAIDLAAERSSLEDTDLSAAIARLNAQTITLEAAQAAFARINRRTLFDILG